MAGPRISKTLAACLVCAVLPACSGTNNPQPSAAAVLWPIVDLKGPLWTAQDRWTLEAEPFLTTGDPDEGAGAGSLRRISSALMLDDRSVVIGDGRTGLVHRLSSRALLQSTAGGHGADPGKFAELADLRIFHGRTPAQVLVTDEGNQRVQVITFGGAEPDCVRLDRDAELIGVFGDGSWLVQFLARASSTKPGPLTHRRHFWRYAPDGRAIRRVVSTDLPGRFVNADGRVSDYFVPLAVQPGVAAGRDRVWVAPGAEPSVDAYSPDGTPLARYRWKAERRLADDARARLERDWDRMPPADRAVLRTLAAPRHLPAYARMLVDDGGNLWCDRYRMRWESRSPHTWDVIDPARGWLGSVTTPPDLEILSIARGVVLGRVRTASGAQQLQGYRILTARRPASAGGDLGRTAGTAQD